MKTPIKTAGILFAAVVLHSTSAAFAGAIEPRLWVIDGSTNKNYELTVNGGVTINSSFPVLGNAKSGLAVDPYDGTLWGLSEQTIALPRGSVVNYTRGGALLSVISAVTFGGFSLEGVAADYFGNSLWVVDDPTATQQLDGEVPTVYHIEKDGTIIDSFATSTFDSDAKSPQAIAADPFDGTLWLTNNSPLNDRIYHIERNGDLISSFESATYDVAADNPQGITVDESNHTLWVTDRLSDQIYNITTTGDLISSFQSTEVDINALNVTAIAYDSRTTKSVPEPATLTIFALGLAGLGILRRRRAA